MFHTSFYTYIYTPFASHNCRLYHSCNGTVGTPRRPIQRRGNIANIHNHTPIHAYTRTVVFKLFITFFLFDFISFPAPLSPLLVPEAFLLQAVWRPNSLTFNPDSTAPCNRATDPCKRGSDNHRTESKP